MKKVRAEELKSHGVVLDNLVSDWKPMSITVMTLRVASCLKISSASPKPNYGLRFFAGLRYVYSCVRKRMHPDTVWSSKRPGAFYSETSGARRDDKVVSLVRCMSRF